MITQACKESWFITKEWYSVWFHCLASFPTPLPCILPTQCFACWSTHCLACCRISSPLPCILPTQCFACWSTHCLACCRISSALHFANPVLCMLVNPLPCMLPNFLCLAFCQPSALHVGQPTALHVAKLPQACILPTQCFACWWTHFHCLASFWTFCLNEPWLTSARIGIELTDMVCKCCHSMRFGFLNCAEPVCNRVSTKKIKYWPTKHLRL